MQCVAQPTNEMWWADFDKYLVETYGADKGFYSCIYPQMRQVIVHTLLSVKAGMENTTENAYQARTRPADWRPS